MSETNLTTNCGKLPEFCLSDKREDSICGNKLGFGFYPEEAVQKHTKAFLEELKGKDTWMILCPFCGRRLNQEEKVIDKVKYYFCQDCKKIVIAKEMWVVDIKDIDKLAQKHFGGIVE